MKKFQLFIIIAIIAMINTNNIYAQSADADYIEMRDKAKVLFQQGKFSSALQMYDGAAGFISNKDNFAELNRLRNELRDTVKSIYNQSISLAHNAKSKYEYSYAIQSFKRLLPVDELYVPSIYSWIGYCYEHLNEPYAAIEQYEKGLAHDEEYFSAWQLAKMLPKYRTTTEAEIIRLYEIAAKHDVAAYDELGDYLIRRYPQKAYEYYKLSKTQYGKYQIASLILSNKINASENALSILKELSDEKYAAAQFYLGLLYFHGSNNISRNTSIGLNLIQKAADGGYYDAIHWQKERQRELYKYY